MLAETIPVTLKTSGINTEYKIWPFRIVQFFPITDVSMVPILALKNGVKMPMVGLGTWELTGRKCEEVVKAALNMGYSHIDTADYYQNHRSIGKAIKGFERKDLFITTKVMPPKLGYDDVLAAFERFLEELDTSYADLLLIHWRGRVPLEEKH